MKRFFPLLCLCMLTACGTPHSESQAKKYLQDQGYQVVSSEGKVDSYVLTKKKLVEMPYMIYWGLQQKDPTPYLNKTIDVEKFIVAKHPLSTDKVDAYVYVVDEKAIGGMSSPHADGKEIVLGGYYSLDGKTIEELQSKTFQEWMKDWKEKYKE